MKYVTSRVEWCTVGYRKRGAVGDLAEPSDFLQPCRNALRGRPLRTNTWSAPTTGTDSSLPGETVRACRKALWSWDGAGCHRESALTSPLRVEA